MMCFILTTNELAANHALQDGLCDAILRRYTLQKESV
jgi:hypothetical protein